MYYARKNNVGCVYVCINFFVKFLTSFSGMQTSIEYPLKIPLATFSVKHVAMIKQLLALEVKLLAIPMKCNTNENATISDGTYEKI